MEERKVLILHSDQTAERTVMIPAGIEDTEARDRQTVRVALAHQGYRCSICRKNPVSTGQTDATPRGHLVIAALCGSKECQGLARGHVERQGAPEVLSEARCTICGTLTKQRCARCSRAYYCSAECQKKEFAKHKFVCRLMENPEEAGEK